MKYYLSDSEGGGWTLKFTEKSEVGAGQFRKGGVEGERFRAAFSSCIIVYI